MLAEKMIAAVDHDGRLAGLLVLAIFGNAVPETWHDAGLLYMVFLKTEGSVFSTEETPHL
jgi:hypothetical protein